MYHEGLVTTVDVHRNVCKVICRNGLMLRDVYWTAAFGGMGRGGMHYTPMARDVVKVASDNKGGYYIAAFCPPTVFEPSDYNYIGRARPMSEFYSKYVLSSSVPGSYAAPASPFDTVPGDFSVTRNQGSVSLTNTGSVQLKASSFASLLFSPLGDVGRMVVRTYRQYTEASKKVQETLQGRIYQYYAWYHTGGASRSDDPDYEEIVGDVPAGESTRGNITKAGDLAPQDDRIYTRNVKERYRESLDIQGEGFRYSTDEGGNTSREDLTNSSWKMIVEDASGQSYKEILANRIEVSSVQDGSSIMSFGGDGQVTLKASQKVFIDCDDIKIGSSVASAILLDGNVEVTGTMAVHQAMASAVSMGAPALSVGAVSAGSTTVSSPSITGSSDGTLTVATDVLAGPTSVSLVTHIHNYTTSGGGTAPTTPPVA